MAVGTLNLDQYYNNAQFSNSQAAANLQQTLLANQVSQASLDASKASAQNLALAYDAENLASQPTQQPQQQPQQAVQGSPIAQGVQGSPQAQQPQMTPSGQVMPTAMQPQQPVQAPAVAGQPQVSPNGQVMPASMTGQPQGVIGQPVQAQPDNTLAGYTKTPEQKREDAGNQQVSQQTPHQQDVAAGQSISQADAQSKLLDARLKSARIMQKDPGNYTAGVAKEKAVYDEMEKLSVIKERDYKHLTESLDKQGGILNTVVDQGSLDNAHMQMKMLGVDTPPAIAGKDGKLISTKVFTPELKGALDKIAEGTLKVKEQLDEKRSAETAALAKTKQDFDEKQKLRDEKRADSKEAREKALQPLEMQLKKADIAYKVAETKKIEQGAEGGGQAIPGTTIGSNASDKFVGKSGTVYQAPVNNKDAVQIFSNLNSGYVNPGKGIAQTKLSVISTAAEEIQKTVTAIPKLVQNDGLSSAGTFSKMKGSGVWDSLSKAVGQKATTRGDQQWYATLLPLAKNIQLQATGGGAGAGGQTVADKIEGSILAGKGTDDYTKIYMMGELNDEAVAGVKGASANQGLNSGQREGLVNSFTSTIKAIPFNKNDVLDWEQQGGGKGELPPLQDFQQYLNKQGKSFGQKTKPLPEANKNMAIGAHVDNKGKGIYVLEDGTYVDAQGDK